MCKPKPIIGHTIKSMLGHIAIEVTADRMEVFLTLLPDSDAGQGFSVSEIQTILTEEGIVHGIRLNTIERSVEEANAIGDPVEGILIGEATPMQPQKDAHIQYNFRTSSKVEFKEDEQGRVNYQELGLINSVSQGEILAQKIPLEEGIAGLSLYGEVINPGAPKDVHLVTGKNVEMTEDSLSCRALCTGQVLLKNRIINVTHLYEVPHDVDLNIGNITFNGAVLIRGNVLGGFSIKATESVTVLGIVEGATIVCGGVLVIKGGIKGGDKCDIRCKADLVTSFVEGASIECHGNLYVETSIINSHVKCYSKIQMGTRKGIIVGGDVLGVQGIHCQETG
ncbi:DUF342 domain-containing protein, partial [bacterium]|nr:DUF342 domain-containing protein [bacterium]